MKSTPLASSAQSPRCAHPAPYPLTNTHLILGQVPPAIDGTPLTVRHACRGSLRHFNDRDRNPHGDQHGCNLRLFAGLTRWKVVSLLHPLLDALL